MKEEKEIRLDFYSGDYKGERVLNDTNYSLEPTKTLHDNLNNLYKDTKKYFNYFCEAYLLKLIANSFSLDGRWWLNEVYRIYCSIGDDTFIKLYINGEYQKIDSEILYKKYKKYKDNNFIKDERWKKITQKEYTGDKYYDARGRYNLNLYKELIEYYKLNGFDEMIYIYEDFAYHNYEDSESKIKSGRCFRGNNWHLSLLIYNFAYQMFHEQDKTIKNKQNDIIIKKYKVCFKSAFDCTDLKKYYQERDEYIEQKLYNKVYEDYKKNGLDKIIIPIPAFYTKPLFKYANLEPLELYRLDWDKSIEIYKKASKELNNNQTTINQLPAKELTYINELNNQNNYSKNIIKAKVKTRKKEIK